MTAIFYKDDGQNLPLLGTPIVRWVETADLGGRITRGNKGTLTHIHTYKHTHTLTHTLSLSHTHTTTTTTNNNNSRTLLPQTGAAVTTEADKQTDALSVHGWHQRKYVSAVHNSFKNRDRSCCRRHSFQVIRTLATLGDFQTVR